MKSVRVLHDMIDLKFCKVMPDSKYLQPVCLRVLFDISVTL